MKIEVNTHEKNILRLAEEHPELVVLSADLGTSCEVKKFRAMYPDRYFTMGIAEQNMTSWAAGLAREGYRPFIHTFAVFEYRRVLDQVEMSVAYPNLPVVFVGFVPGITTPGGVSHQSINDVAVMRSVPNMAIFDVGDATDIDYILDMAYDYNGPVYIRQLRKEVPRLFPADEPVIFNRARVLSEGDDVVILSSSICTEEAMRATAVLKERGIEMKERASHGGLECGVFRGLIPDLDIITYGPISEGEHTPDEKLDLASFDRAYENLLTVLERCR